MKNLLNPKWLLVINTLPIIILFSLYWGEYNIIKTLLKEEHILVWTNLALALGTLGIVNFFYTLYLILQKKEVPPVYGILSLLCYISFLYAYGYHSNDLIPFTVPRWMVPDALILYAGTFLMPSLAYSLFTLVGSLTQNTKEHKAWKNFLIAIAIPIAWYLFIEVVIPFWKVVESDFGRHTLVILVITGTLVFLFFISRGIYIISLKKAAVWQKYQLVWKIPVAIVFPLLGLALNNGDLPKPLELGEAHIFGDFSNYWFYILALVNGILICLPATQNKTYRLLLFAARSLTFSYTFYFFVVFLPYLPLSVIAIVVIGAGFLMLTPLVLFIIHANELSGDFGFLKTHFSTKTLTVALVLGFLILPVCITCTYLHDRKVLDQSLDYIYNPDFTKEYTIDNESLSKTITVVKYHKERGRGGFGGKQIPYLSSYFNWIVLDNLTLSDAKINTIENIFFGSASFQLRDDDVRNKGVEISKISSGSRFDKNQNAWISTVDLEITNSNTEEWFAEYATTLELPTGCWISDYYLYVGDKKEPGILAEKKSAMWVFSQIRNSNRDPGILFYLTGNKVSFRIFPFTKGEVRKTGIEFIHKEPVKLTIDGNTVTLGNDAEQPEVATTESADKNVVYIPAAQKQLLPIIERKPFYHFIVDISKGKEKSMRDFTARIDDLMSKNNAENTGSNITFCNTYTSTPFNVDEQWKQRYESRTFAGGFYLDRAIKEILSKSYQHPSFSFPVIVVVSDSLEHAIIENNFADFKPAFPESDLFYTLDADGELIPHSLVSNPRLALNDTLAQNYDQKVLAFPSFEHAEAFLRNDNEPSVIIKKSLFSINEAAITKKNWQSALAMQGKWFSQVLHPETAEKEWLNLVKYSFISRVMSPVTSYLVVENEAQKAILKKKQEQVLSGNKNLDLDEDSQRMSEPGLILMAIFLALGLWFIEKRKRRLKLKS